MMTCLQRRSISPAISPRSVIRGRFKGCPGRPPRFRSETHPRSNARSGSAGDDLRQTVIGFALDDAFAPPIPDLRALASEPGGSTRSGHSLASATMPAHAPEPSFESVPLSWDGTLYLAKVAAPRQMFADIL